MKFSCEKALLQEAVNSVFRAAAQRSTIPALEGVLIECGARLTLTGYNMLTGVSSSLDCDCISAGAVVVDAKMLAELIRRLPDDIVMFSADEKFSVNVKCGVSDFNLMGMSADDYPELPEVNGELGFSIEQGRLKNMISKTVFSVSESETRPVHTGELFDISQNTLALVAVDGYRLALRREALEGEDIGETKFVVPSATMRELEKILADSDEPVSIVRDVKHIIFRMGDTTVVSRLLEGEFLDYRKVVPQNGSIQIHLLTKQLLRCVDRASLIISETVKSPVRLIFGKDEIKVLSSSTLGDVFDVCQSAGDGGLVETGFNNRYLLEALRAIPDEELKIEFSSATTPMVMKSKTDDESWLYMVLPVRLKK